jgi:hypothetical protein
VLARLRSELDGTGQAALVAHRPVEQRADVVVGERAQGEEQRPRQQRRDHRERRVLGGRGDQHHPAVLHAGQQGVLLGLGEAVDLVEEEHGLPAVHAATVAGLLHHPPDVLDTGGDGGQLDEAASGGVRHHVRGGRLAGTGRAPQDHRGRACSALRPLRQAAQRRAGGQQVPLSDQLVDRARTHPHSQRRARTGRGARRGCIRAGVEIEQVRHT